MRNTFVGATLAVAALFSTGCELLDQVQMTPMEIQAMQTREYDVDKKIAFGAVMSVIQDLGFTVNAADLDTGFIQASGQSRSDRWSLGEQLFIFAVSDTEIADQDTVETVKEKLTAYIEPTLSGGSRVRLNLIEQTHTSGLLGQNSTDDYRVLEAEVYQNAFERISSAIFVRTESDRMSQ